MPLKPLPIGAGSNLDIDGTTAHDGASIIWYNAYMDRGQAIHTFPGLTLAEDLGVSSDVEVFTHFNRGLGILLVIAGGRVWAKTSALGGLTELTGAVLESGYPPVFTDNGTDIFFAANGPINKYGATVTQIGGNAPDKVTGLAYIGGYIKAIGDDSAGSVDGDTFYSDDKDNGYALWEVYNNESSPDGVQALVVAFEQVYNIGDRSVEVAYVDGTVPFSVNKNAAQHFGTPAPHSVVFDGESIYYISQVTESRKIVKLTGGGSPTIISFPVDVPLEQFERVDDARGFLMAFKGQNFYVLDFPTANTVIDDQLHTSVTLAFHIQTQQWLVLAKWNGDDGQWQSYRGCSFAYSEPWGTQFVGGRDGKLYTLNISAPDPDYTASPIFTHRWRSKGSRSGGTNWTNGRNIPLGVTGDYTSAPDSLQCGDYRHRQHELSFYDLSDAGEIFRALIRSGWINHQVDIGKVANFYRYNVKRGSGEFIINTISEDVTYLRR
jgi:hypothetical protein